MPGAFDLTNSAVGHSRRAQEMPLGGPPRERLPPTAQRRINCGVTCDDALSHEPGDKCFRILKVRDSPRRQLSSQNDST